jgi:hypothetical protein
MLMAVAGLAFPAVAAADPPPVDPAAPVDAAPLADPAAIPPPGPPPGMVLGPLGAVTGGSPLDLILGQYPVPSAPGGQPAAPPSADLLNAGQFLNPTNYRVPPPDQVSPYPLAQGEPGPFARVDGLKGLHAIVHGALGRMPADQLSEPLPGTAPPPGTNIPAGPVQNLPDPAIAEARVPADPAAAQQDPLLPPLPGG